MCVWGRVPPPTHSPTLQTYLDVVQFSSDTKYLEFAQTPWVQGSVSPDCPNTDTSCESWTPVLLTPFSGLIICWKGSQNLGKLFYSLLPINYKGYNSGTVWERAWSCRVLSRHATLLAPLRVHNPEALWTFGWDYGGFLTEAGWIYHWPSVITSTFSSSPSEAGSGAESSKPLITSLVPLATSTPPPPLRPSAAFGSGPSVTSLI